MTSQATVDTARSEMQAVAGRMTEAAEAFVASLQPGQRDRAVLAFEESERRRWFYTPTEQGGLTLVEMSADQQRAAHRLVATGVSLPGYATISAIMGIENTLDAYENWGVDAGWMARYPGRTSHARGRDPMMYFLSVFGDPSGSGPWGWRYGGHHVSLNYTIVNGDIASPCPMFFGANPADSQLVGADLLRPLAGTEDLGRDLLRALDDSQRATAIISPVAPLDIMQSNRPVIEDDVVSRDNSQIFGFDMPAEVAAMQRERNERRRAAMGGPDSALESLRFTRTPKGLAAAAMTAGQKALLTALLRQYLDRMPGPLAERELAKLTGATFDAIHFAWAGRANRREPHYYRLQGPRFLVEYDNVQNDSNHIHSVWRDPDSDFGADLLAQHYAGAHGRTA